jgi:hypothetical protein
MPVLGEDTIVNYTNDTDVVVLLAWSANWIRTLSTEEVIAAI